MVLATTTDPAPSNGSAMSTSSRRLSFIVTPKRRSIPLFSKVSGFRWWKPCISAVRLSAPIPRQYRTRAATLPSTSTTSLLSFEQTLLSALRRLRLERESIRAASCRQASRFTWHDFGRKTAEAIARTVVENARESQILNTDEIVGFPKPHAEKSTHQGTAMSGAGFDLVDELRRVKRAEIARITELAERLLIQLRARHRHRISILRDARAAT